MTTTLYWAKVAYVAGVFIGKYDRISEPVPKPVQNFFALATPLMMIVMVSIVFQPFMYLLNLILFLMLLSTVTKLFHPTTIPFVGLSTGRSMFPSISRGYTFIVLSVQDEYSVGDVVLFERNNKSYIHHRIVEKRDDGLYVTKGDNNRYCDEPIKKEQIVARNYTFRGKPIYIPLSIFAIIETIVIISSYLFSQK